MGAVFVKIERTVVEYVEVCAESLEAGKTLAMAHGHKVTDATYDEVDYRYITKRGI